MRRRMMVIQTPLHVVVVFVWHKSWKIVAQVVVWQEYSERAG
jgi:hypothetical protein